MAQRKKQAAARRGKAAKRGKARKPAKSVRGKTAKRTSAKAKSKKRATKTKKRAVAKTMVPKVEAVVVDIVEEPVPGDVNGVYNKFLPSHSLATLASKKPSEVTYIGGIPALLIISRHLTVSDAINFSSSSGPGETGSAPCSVKRAFTVGSFTASASAL